MAKQILIGIKGQKLSEVAYDLMINFPYNEEMCSYTDVWMEEPLEMRYLLNINHDSYFVRIMRNNTIE